MTDQPERSSDLLHIAGRKETLAKLLGNDQNKNSQEPTLPKEKPKMFKIDPSSDILSRVQSFLPQLQSANEQLKGQDPSKLDIENVDEQDQYIEMNLGLGVFEEKKPGDSSDSEQDDSDDDIVIPSTASKPKEKPNIELLDSNDKA
ncbi:hypothetical protein BJV82DRAFT_224505 [Fennellomyces sp. T-0311]|nr:hypothetical protein BJV82DRAFT_224505 [Fennellomyces sp. T-0311]